MPRVRSAETVGAVAVVVTGTLLHFVYEWSGGNQLVGVVAPVNESVWEHLKLVVFPVIAYAGLEFTCGVDRARLWWAKFVEIVAASAFIVAFFYSYTGALGVDSVVAVDIGSFVVAIALGQWLSYRLLVRPAPPPVPLWTSVAAVTALVVLFGVLTFAPPHVPLFEDTSTGLYGALPTGETPLAS